MPGAQLLPVKSCCVAVDDMHVRKTTDRVVSAVQALSSLLAFVGLVGFGIAGWALFKGQSPRMRIANRKIAGGVLAGSLGLATLAGALAPAEEPSTKVVTNGVTSAGVVPSEPETHDSTTTSTPATTSSTEQPTTTTTAAATTTTTAKPATTTTTVKPTTTTARPTTTTTRLVTTTTVRRGSCDPSYPDVCIPPAPPDLDCPEISYKNFRVVGIDPHGFDADNDGIGCEKN